MSGRKHKKSNPALSSATPLTSGTVITDTATALPTCSCEKEVEEIKKLISLLYTREIQTLHNAFSSLSEAFRESLPRTSDVIAALEKNLSNNIAKTKARFTVIEDSVSELRTNVTEKLKAMKISSLPATTTSMLDQQSINCTNTISSIQNGLRNLNKRIRKNNIVIHGLENSNQDCTVQADTFFQTHLNLKLPIHQAYRLCSSSTDQNAPLLVVFNSLHSKLKIFKNCKMLAATKFSIQDDLSPEEREERNRKLPIFKSYRAQKKKVVFRGSDLYVDGQILNC